MQKDDILDLALPSELLELGEMLSHKSGLRHALLRQAGNPQAEQVEAFINELLVKACKDASACKCLRLRKGMPKASIIVRIKVVSILAWQSLRLSADPIDIGDLAASVADPKQTPNEGLLRARHEIGIMVSEDTVLGTYDGDGPIRKIRLPFRSLEWLSGGKSSFGVATIAKLVGLSTPAESFRDNKPKAQPEQDLSPKQLFEGIKARVIGLDEQAKLISGRLAMHLSRAKMLRAGNDPGTPNECWCIIGPPGVGKTHLCEVAGNLSSTVYASVDASDLTADGYVGLAMSDTLRYLIMAANGDMDRARYGLLALDEFTKKARSMGESPINTVAVQQEALRTISGQIMTIGGRRGYDRPVSFNTLGTCFALLGHCPGLDRMVEKRMGSHEMGFALGRCPKKNRDLLLGSLGDFGIIDEILSRLTLLLIVQPPSLSTLMKAVNAEHGIVDSYNRLLEGHGAMLYLQDSAVRALADYGMESGGYFRAMKRAISTLAGEIVFDEQKGTIMVEAADIHRAATKADGDPADLLGKRVQGKA